MPVSVDGLNLKNNESLVLTVNGSAELALTIHVTKEGHCFVSGPMSSHMNVLRLTKKGFTRVRGIEQRMRALTS